MNSSKIIIVFIALTLFLAQQAISKKTVEEKLDFSGVHPMSSYWFGDIKKGKIKFEKVTDSVYNVEGHQLKESDFVEIKGKIEFITDKSLLFTGFIRSKVQDYNEGALCEKKGIFVFDYQSKSKAYRIKEVLNCVDNDEDYIDIHLQTLSKNIKTYKKEHPKKPKPQRKTKPIPKEVN
jgi:hypothetical protein